MIIRFAAEKDIPKLGDLLRQVCLVHHKGRPDIFNAGRKYTDQELVELLKDITHIGKSLLFSTQKLYAVCRSTVSSIRFM